MKLMQLSPDSCQSHARFLMSQVMAGHKIKTEDGVCKHGQSMQTFSRLQRSPQS